VNTARRNWLTDLLAPAIAGRGCIGATRDGQLLNVNADTRLHIWRRRWGRGRLVIAGGTAGVLDEAGQNNAQPMPAAARPG